MKTEMRNKKEEKKEKEEKYDAYKVVYDLWFKPLDFRLRRTDLDLTLPRKMNRLDALTELNLRWAKEENWFFKRVVAHMYGYNK